MKFPNSISLNSISLIVSSALLLSSGCAAIAAQHNEQLDRAVSLSPVNQHAYTKVAVESFYCSDGGYECQGPLGQQASDQLSITLSRLGYQVFDSQQFYAMVVSPPVVVATEQPSDGVSASMQVGPDGISMSAGQTPGVVVYETLPAESREVIVQRSGIAGVVSGRITMSPADPNSDWREYHVMIRLSDAITGAVVWQGERREDFGTGMNSTEAVRDLTDFLNRALERKAPLSGPPPQQL